jgi:hypothetical protein
MDFVDKLNRKALVIAAEKAAKEIDCSSKGSIKPTQLNRLISVCAEAICAEEITNYLRYQASRKVLGRAGDVDHILQGIEPILGEIKVDSLRVEAFRLYAVFLTRSFRYQHEIARQKQDDEKNNAGKQGSR